MQGNGVRTLWGQSATGVARWQLVLGDGSNESGNNTGSQFKLYAYGDDGQARATVLSANRDTGLLSVAGNPTANQGIATKAYVDANVPIGVVIPFVTPNLPVAMQTQWQVCSGGAHTSQALFDLTGSWNVPDLRGLFIVGQGQNADTALAPTNYAAGTGAKAGKESVALTQAQTPVKSHTHSIDHTHGAGTSGPGTSHNHTINHNHPSGTTGPAGTHTHGGYHNNWVGSSMDQNPAGTDYSPIGQGPGHPDPPPVANTAPNHTHTFDVADFSGTSGPEGAHTHSTSVVGHTGSSGPGADAAATAHENRPPYYALVYIIKKA